VSDNFEAVGRIREMLGEMSGTVKAILEQQREQKIEFRTEIRSVKDDQRQIETAQIGKLDALTKQLRELEKTAGTLNEQVVGFASGFSTMKSTVEDLTKVKDRVMTYGAIGLTLFGVVSYILAPFLSELAKKVVHGLLG